MKKIYTLIALAIIATTANAQTTSIFDAADVDANGWLWLDTQAKIDKYVGIINEEDFVIDPNGKVIQMVYANQMSLDYPAPTADPAVKGVGSDAEVGGANHKVGGIILNAGTGTGGDSSNGGGIALMMPSCAELSLSLSCEGTMGGYLAYSKDVASVLDKYTMLHAYTNIVWGKLSSAGMFEWSGMETIYNGNDEAMTTLKSEAPINAYFINGAKSEMFVHGIKLNIYGSSNGINDIKGNGNGMAEVFTITGRKVAVSANGTINRNSVPAGIYLVRKNGVTRKVTLK